MRIPRLYLGLIGFDATAEDIVRRQLAEHAKQVQAEKGTVPGRLVIWSIADFKEADALLIYGATAIDGSGDSVRFKASPLEMSQDTPLGVHIGDITQPFAISHPTHLQALGVNVKTYPVFDLSIATSLPIKLQQFETVLRRLRNLYTLAVELTTRRENLHASNTYHLEFNGRVDAIVDLPQREILLRPGARTADIATAKWQKRPKAANYAPDHYIRCTFAELTWMFAMHCKDPDLPSRYLTRPIYLQAMPNIRNSLLYPRHASLLDEMAGNAYTMDQLKQALPWHSHWIPRDLYALFLLRSISTSGHVDDPLAIPSIPNETEGEAKVLLNRMGQHLATMRSDLKPLIFGDSPLVPD